MSEHVARLPVRPSPLEQALDLLQRVAALVCLVIGIFYWVRLLGIYEGVEWRIDLMPLYWQLAAVPLAVLFPFAAVGLWMLASWGPVVWFLCAAAEITMYGFFPGLYGFRPLIIALHIAVAAFYAVMRTMLYVRQRREAN